jgi:hypothetical protein
MSATASPATDATTGILTENKGDLITLTIPGSDYRIHLVTRSPIAAPLNHRITGHIHARAKRVDAVPSGGRFIEPVYGRPRRLQGSIFSTDPEHHTITVRCGAAFICELTMNQSAAEFHHGQLVSFDIESGAWFEPI